MGCPGLCNISDSLTFSICTHDPDTGVLTDADSVPTYRVYEDVTETAILTGNMDDGTGASDQFDNANTTGFYCKEIDCTIANGFEANKTYTIYIEATVDSDTGGISFAFKCISPSAGPIEFTYTLTDADSGDPIADAKIWATTDSAGTHVINEAYTNASGVVVFNLEAGTYYFFRKKAGYNFTNPDTETVSAS